MNFALKNLTDGTGRSKSRRPQIAEAVSATRSEAERYAAALCLGPGGGTKSDPKLLKPVPLGIR